MLIGLYDKTIVNNCSFRSYDPKTETVGDSILIDFLHVYHSRYT